MIMQGIPQALMPSLQQALMDCDEFGNQNDLYNIFASDLLKPWQPGLPETTTRKARVNSTLSYLENKYRRGGENALILLLRALGEEYASKDERHDRLLNLAELLEWYKQLPSKPEVPELEANPEKAQMIWISEVESIYTCARSVARIQVPRYVNGYKEGDGNSGTAWLIAPGLVLTCWHVIENRGKPDTSLNQTDLDRQVKNALLTFDYTADGKGLQYKILSLEYPTIESRTLDYALLRVENRVDLPLQERGYLGTDAESPLTTQTSLYIIQHPLGQGQQSAEGTFVDHSLTEHCIVYTTPTEPGTSGAPVLNRANWQVVALHNGENAGEQLREGTLMKSILEDIRQHRSELYDEIMAVQNKTQNKTTYIPPELSANLNDKLIPRPTLRELRQRLEQQFDDPGIDAFCLDYFPDIYDKFSRGMRKDEKITVILDDCRRSPENYQKLLARIEK
ncbi:hypothetical protein GF339_21405 [candidate division KSB3 bacterium]|uniref:Bacterial Death-like domain-containing protein n=1 Tax=candidate division KSB3 bacterium TaxID=2044937 RepID=A0A9D5K0L6_9BACT|nr:hypothetical protein [candidate division KSB3 bacterium]MBD3327157.1 hypothetical protein [candidate division KSB3 bacterium]